MNAPQIDRNQIEAFFEGLFIHARPDGPGKAFFAFRAFDESNQQVFSSFSADLYDRRKIKNDLCREAERCAKAPGPVTFCPLVCTLNNSKKAGAKDIAQGLVLTVECDARPNRARLTLEALLGPATFVVRSGGRWENPETGEIEDKLHLHWRLKEPAEGAHIARLQMARAKAAELVGGDATNVPPSHPIRWPGSIHRKGEPRLAQIITQSDSEIDLDAALALLGVAAEESPPARPNGHCGQGEDWAPLIESIRSGERYHESLTILAAKYTAAGMNGDAIVNQLRALMQTSQAPRDERWQARFDDIPRDVKTAEEKFGRPTGENGADDSEQILAEYGINLRMAAREAGDSCACEAIVSLPGLNPIGWEDEPVLPREWRVPDYIPHRTVTLLSGDGGLGKSLLGLQLAAAMALGRDWIGLLPEPGRTLVVSAEDDADEMHRRLDDIRKFSGAAWEDLADIRLVDLVGEDSILGQLVKGRIEPTAVFAALEGSVRLFRPHLVILDVLAALFAGQENDRSQVRQFVNLLKGLAKKHDCAILLLSHPSQAGMNAGTGSSGSTDWSNAVRRKVYLETPRETTDKNLRTFRGMKNNYGETGGAFDIEWRNGVFIRVNGPSGYDKAALEQKADDVFLKLLTQFSREGRDVSPNKSPSFAPAVFARHPDAGGLPSNALSAAMDRLLKAGKVKIQTSGPPSRRMTRLVLGGECGDA